MALRAATIVNDTERDLDLMEGNEGVYRVLGWCLSSGKTYKLTRFNVDCSYLVIVNGVGVTVAIPSSMLSNCTKIHIRVRTLPDPTFNAEPEYHMERPAVTQPEDGPEEYNGKEYVFVHTCIRYIVHVSLSSSYTWATWCSSSSSDLFFIWDYVAGTTYLNFKVSCLRFGFTGHFDTFSLSVYVI